ncbi:hypothetical protein SAMN04488526_1134 [Jannaschia helgolandensis]|uniref:Transposase n=1 Tax=Jannaschia helgolandensis TaxID=188906 RepID=A0A1H7IQD1_9RHOB|nr:hypothetical protein SAMN04488526_1134 [Jannaschia helgolandensis]
MVGVSVFRRKARAHAVKWRGTVIFESSVDEWQILNFLAKINLS